MIIKRSLSLLLLCAVMMTFSSCTHGIVSFAEIVEVDSEIYSEEDIQSAIDIVISRFREGWTATTLLEVKYIGDDHLDSYQDWADRNDADEVIVILVDFYISRFANNPVMGNDVKYEDYNYILVRNEGEEWQIVDKGY